MEKKKNEMDGFMPTSTSLARKNDSIYLETWVHIYPTKSSQTLTPSSIFAKMRIYLTRLRGNTLLYRVPPHFLNWVTRPVTGIALVVADNE